jgi:hypothetical protein
MSALAIGVIAFLCVFGTAMAGMFARSRLPDEHLSAESREAIKLATAVIGTVSALALGLLIASAKRSFDEAGSDTRNAAARVQLIDRVLAHYGPDAGAMRAPLRAIVEARLNPAGAGGDPGTPDQALDVEPIQNALHTLTPTTEAQRWLKARALQLTAQMAEARWQSAESEVGAFPGAFLVFLILWLALLFGSFGLLAPRNGTVVAVFLVCALSITGALVLIIDMDHPYLGFIQVSDGPWQRAHARLGQP